MSVMRKTILMTVAFLLFYVPGFASIPNDEASIAGLTVGETGDYVKKLYGEPNKVYEDGDFRTFHFHALYVTVGKDNLITRITSHSSSYQNTPAGINFGTPIKELKKVYGKPDQFAFGINGCSYLYSSEDGKKYIEFTYEADGHMREVRVGKRDV